MAELSVSKKAIEAALAVDNAASTAEAAVDTRRLAALQFFAPAEKIGGSYNMLAKPTGDDAKNNLWVSVRNWAYDVCATVVCGEAGLKFLRDETTTGKAEMAVTHGKLKGQTRDKKYLQQSKSSSSSASGSNGNGKDAVERQDCDRFLDAIAKAHKQVSKAKPDGSIPQEYADAFAEMFAKLK